MKKYILTIVSIIFLTYFSGVTKKNVSPQKKELSNKTTEAYRTPETIELKTASSLVKKTEKTSEILKPRLNFSEQLTEYRKITNVIIKSEFQQSNLNAILSDEQFSSSLKKSLSDTRLLNDNFFKQRMELLNILYEGINSKELNILNQYQLIAINFFDQNPLNLSAREKVQFSGDRVELAMVITNLGKDQDFLKRIPAEMNEKVLPYFVKAERMLKIYRVSL